MIDLKQHILSTQDFNAKRKNFRCHTSKNGPQGLKLVKINLVLLKLQHTSQFVFVAQLSLNLSTELKTINESGL